MVEKASPPLIRCQHRVAEKRTDGQTGSRHSALRDNTFASQDPQGFTLSVAKVPRISDVTNTPQVPHAQRQQMSNSSSITKFLLLAFADTWKLQLLQLWLFLGICWAMASSSQPQPATHTSTPLLSLLDLGFMSTTAVPKSMANSLWDTRTISYYGCASQFFFFFFILISVELPSANPCTMGPSWTAELLPNWQQLPGAVGFLYAVLHTTNTFSLLLFQGNAVDQFLCEIPHILKLSCSSSYLREAGLVMVGVSLAFGGFIFIVLPYVQIFRAVLRIPSEQGRHKAFSTCLPHLAVVSLFVSTAMFAYLKPPSISFPSLDLVMAVLYSEASLAVNPSSTAIPSLQRVDHMTQLGVISKLAEGALNPTVRVADNDVKQHWSQNQPLRKATSHCIEETTALGSCCHVDTSSAAQGGPIVQGFADSNVAVIGHDSEETQFCYNQKDKQKVLGSTSQVGDGPGVPEKIGHGFRDSGGDEAQIDYGEVEDEEVHGGVEVLVTGYGCDDEAVAQQGSHVDAQEEPEVQELQLSCVWEWQEEELSDGAAVGHLLPLGMGHCPRRKSQ
ncbi:hypothetical protein QYF61_027685 [Mycteria americana]|uniref:Uncharacterized protein n=1 Tax=Mycteria americana TaxID=33587 RepID=A0AAN7MJ69_MYCAM|nr:hypothetical protein QYF61_027685 [Mycteria americana]